MRHVVSFEFDADLVEDEYFDCMDRFEMMRPSKSKFQMADLLYPYAYHPIVHVFLILAYRDEISAHLRKQVGLAADVSVIRADATSHYDMPFRCVGCSLTDAGTYSADFAFDDADLAMVLKLAARQITPETIRLV